MDYYHDKNILVKTNFCGWVRVRVINFINGLKLINKTICCNL